MLGVVLKAATASSTNKQHIVLLLKPELPPMSRSPTGTSNALDTKSSEQGYYVMPKSKRGLDDEYFSSATPRKGTGAINITLPHMGVAAGMSYEVRGIDIKEFLCICNCRLKIDQVGLLEHPSPSIYSKTVQELQRTKIDGNKYPPSVDPIKGMSSFCMKILIGEIYVFDVVLNGKYLVLSFGHQRII